MTVVSMQQTPPPSPHPQPQHAASSSTKPSHAQPDEHQREHQRAVHGPRADMTLRSDLHGSLPSTATTNGETSRFRAQGDSSPDHDASSNTGDGRPSSAPGGNNGTASTAETRDDLGRERPKRPVKPQLQRSKSDFVPRQADESEPDDEIRGWGARTRLRRSLSVGAHHLAAGKCTLRLPRAPSYRGPRALQVSRDKGVRAPTPPRKSRCP